MMIWLRVCANCSYSLPPIDLFCRSCWRLLTDKVFTSQQSPRNLAPFPVHYLWEWKGEDSLVGHLVYSLKNAALPEAHERLIDYWLQAQPFLVSFKKPGVIVFPTKSLEKKDHAFYLAHALGSRLNVPVHPLLVASSATAYRSLGRQERYRQRKVVRDLRIVGRDLLFIDDVFTTGATAVRAWQSLGEPKGFQACVLAYKGFRLRLEEEERHRSYAVEGLSGFS